MADESLAQRFERMHVRPKPGRTLIVGSQVYGDKEDRRMRYKRAVGVDMQPGPGVDVVAELGPTAPHMGMFAHVECLSVLEHARRPWEVAQYIERSMDVGSTMFLSVPFVWRVHNFPGDLWRFTDQGVRELFPQIDWIAMQYVSNKTRDDAYLKAEEMDGHPYFPRCEVLGFGVRK